MSILTRDELLQRMKDRIGEDTSDDSIHFLEDIADTYDDLDKKAKGDGKDWKAEAERIDNEWRAKYRDRFYNPPNDDDNNDENVFGKPPKKLTFESLFKEE